MKKTLLLLSILLITLATYAQSEFYQYFDGEDTLPYSSINITLNADSNNLWQIGPPQKVMFNSASTAPNVIITDTLNNYPTNNTSVFIAQLGDSFYNTYFYGVVAVQWLQRLDINSNGDIGVLEISTDSMQTWVNAFDNPLTYNFYGFAAENIDTIDGEIGFVGTDTSWRDIWYCFDWEILETETGYLFLKFTFKSDSIPEEKEGWMIDNMYAHLTYYHTLNNTNAEDAINIYPVPADDKINIQLQHTQQPHFIESMSITSMQGSLINTWSNLPSKYFIDTKKYPNGMYVLKVKTNLYTESKTIVIQHNQ